MRLQQSEMFGIEKKIINIVDMATRYGLDGLGIEALCVYVCVCGGGEIFRSRPDRPCG
jgi:hypothetical protein